MQNTIFSDYNTVLTDKSSLVLYDGFLQYPELRPGDVYCIDDYRKDSDTPYGELKLYGFDAWYDELLFSPYTRSDSFQDYDRSGHKKITSTHIPEVGEKYWLRLRRLNWMRNPDRLKNIDISDIQWYQNFKHGITVEKDGMYCPCCEGDRVVEAEIKFPGILLDGTTTASGKRYRSLDGAHRIQKLLYYGHTTAPCYVYHIDEILNYWDPFHYGYH